MLRIDNTALLADKAVINLRLPYLCGEVKVLGIPGAIYDVIFGKVDETRGPEDLDMSAIVGAATTRAQSMRETVTSCGCPQQRGPMELTSSPDLTRESDYKMTLIWVQ
ncbi:hypothetical protein PoB_002509700 [Plakobranchus ocellatus]|uniref:Uncharacterized protein n=1 Tax=Plakobranchus ocellatus TaxID=259542 RepID=A0AAV3ZV87_9GAST|nr:hypothetical protein PoB_002509700 [Plakobranchus ocellatus]